MTSTNVQQSDDAMRERKQAATEFLRLVVGGRIEEAYRTYVDPSGVHHNPFFPAGFPALMKAMIENHTLFPTKQIEVHNVIGDGDLVAVHSHLLLEPGGEGMAVVHIVRFRAGKIVELWDCGQKHPENSPNTDGAF